MMMVTRGCVGQPTVVNFGVAGQRYAPASVATAQPLRCQRVETALVWMRVSILLFEERGRGDPHHELGGVPEGHTPRTTKWGLPRRWRFNEQGPRFQLDPFLTPFFGGSILKWVTLKF